MTTTAAIAPSAVLTTTKTMKAVLHRQYGPPSSLQVAEAPRPTSGPGQLLVRIAATHVTIGDHHIVAGLPYLVRASPFGGLPRPKNPVPGLSFSGRIEGIGDGVTGFAIGDEVFGQTSHGAYAEWTVVDAQHVARRPGGLSLEDAASIPWAATALQGLRDASAMKPGQRVLVVGASGAVGTWAVQVAKALGGHVTAVCSTRNVELVRSLGADAVIDYQQEDFTTRPERYDIVFDLVGAQTLSQLFRLVVPGGVFIPCSGGGGDVLGPLPRMLGAALIALFTGKKVKFFVQQPSGADFATLAAWVEAGKARPVVEQRFPFAQVSQALEHVGEGHGRGQTLLVMR